MAKIQIKNSFITSSAQITISSSLVRFSDNIRAKGITGSFSGSFAGSNVFVQGGNSFGTTALLGTNDNQPLVLETNASEKMRVTAAGLVGIGTSNPGTKLQVLGDATVGTPGSGGNLWILGDRDWRFIAGTTGYGVGSGFGLFDNTGGAYRIAVDPNGNIGIGTTSPSTPLHVFNTAATLATFTRDLATDVGFSIGADSNGTIFSTAGAHAYLFYTNGTEKMRITAGGNVGIATTSPTAKLQVGTQMYGSAPDANYFVVGNENFSGPGPVGGITGYPATANRNQVTASLFDVAGGWESVNGYHALLRVSSYDKINSTPALTILNNGNLGLGTNSPSHQLTISRPTQASAYQVNFNTDGGISDGNYTGIRFSQGATGGTELGNIRLWYFTTGATALSLGVRNATQALYVATDGNIGIGTTNPVAKLHITGSSTAAVFYGNVGIGTSTFSYPTANRGLLEVFGSTDALIALRSSGTNFYIHKVGVDCYIVNTNSGFISIYNNGSERMRIASDGNIGIGTSNPASILHLNGTAPTILTLSSTSYPSTYLSTFGVDSGARAFLIFGNNGENQIRAGRTSTGGYLDFYTNNTVGQTTLASDGNFVMRLSAGGNVGIGTTSPTAKLTVVNTQRILGILRAESTPRTTFYDDTFAVNNDGGGANGFIYTSGTGGTFPLDYYGELILQAGPRTGYNNGISLVTGTTSPSVKLRVAENGNVGIGTTNPGYKLDVVSGSMRVASGAYAGELYFGTNSNADLYLKRDNNYDLSLVQNASSGNALYLAGAGNVYVSIDSNNNETDRAFIVQNNSVKSGTELFRVNEAGNVGIGTSSPKQKLDVSGAGGKIAITNTGNTDYAELVFYEGSSVKADIWVNGSAQATYAGVNSMNIWQGSNAPIAFYTNGTNERMRISADGNVGIGTSTSVPSPLTVYNNADVWHFRLGSSTGELRFGGATNNGAVIQSYTPAGVVRDLYIQRDGGNVGIGTNAPIALLDVRGNTKFGSSLSNTHQFTGSVNFGGSTYNNSIAIDKFEYFSLQPYIEGGSFPSNVFSLSGTFPTFVTMTGSACPFGKVAYNVSYYEAIGDYIPVQAGETLYGEIWAYRSAGATGTAGVLYCGIARYDKDKKMIDANAGLNYFIVQNATVPSNSTWTKYSNTTTLPLTHTPYAGSDGGPVRYVRPYIIVNYTAGTVPTYWAAFKIRKQQLTRDSGTIFISGSVGIGVSTPAYPLHVRTSANTGTIAIGNVTYPGLISTNAGSGEFRIDNRTSAAAGYITFYPNGEAGSAGSEAMRIITNGNVGIGTSSPSGKLEVRTNVNSNYVFSGTSTSGYTTTFTMDDTASYFGHDSGVRSLILRTNSTARLTIKGDGNVGIGNSTPQTKLEVSGETMVNYTNAILTVQGGSGYGFIRMYGNNSSVEMQIDSHSSNANAGTLGTYTNHPVYIKTNNATKVSITTSGNIGIGTTSPSTTLTVIATNNTGSRIQLGTASTSTFMDANKVNDFMVLTAPFGNNPASVSNGGAKWGIKMNGSIDSINTKGKAACIYAVSEENSTGYNRMVGLALHTSGFDLDSAERVRIKNDGNVGIGTTNPTGSLHVYKAVGVGETAIATIQEGAGGAAELVFRSGNASTNRRGALRFFSNQVSTTTAQWTVGASMSQSSGDNSFYFYNNGSTSVLTLSQTNVGIGSTAPAYKLDVAGGDVNFASTSILRIGTVAVLNESSNANDIYANIRVIRNMSSTIQDGMYINYNSPGTTGAHLRFYANGTSERMRIQANDGFVGIGTSAAVGRLDVYDSTDAGHVAFVRNASTGTSAYSAIVLRRNGDANGIVLFTNSSNRSTDGGAGNSTIRTDNGNLLLGAGGTTYHVLNTAGSVGIGTTSPAYRLDVNGGIASGGVLVALYSGNYNRLYEPAGNPGIYLGNNSDPANYYDNTTHYFRNRGGSSNYAIINSNGNLGIGTSSPVQKLHVVGAVYGTTYGQFGTSVASGTNSSYAVFGSNSAVVGVKINIDSNVNRNDLVVSGSTGNVGIGTSQVLSKLNAYASGSNLSVFRVDGGNGTLFEVTDQLSGSLFSVNDVSGLPLLEVFSNNRVVAGKYGSNALVVSGSSIGIGTSRPSSRLQLGNLTSTQTSATETLSLGGTFSNSAGANVKLRVYEDGSGGAIGGMSVSSGQMEVNTWSAGKIAFYRGTTQTAIIDASGNVGIGSTAPIAKLDINGTTNFAANVYHSIGGQKFFAGSGGAYSYIYTGTTALNFINGGDTSTLMTILNGGSVGIGTTSPGSKLDVNGTFRTAINNLTIFNDYIYVSPTENNTLNSAYFTNGIADMWINYAGYNNGNTQFRNFNVGNGKNSVIAWFDGTNKRMSINNGQAASYTLDVNGSIRTTSKFVQNSTTVSVSGTGQTLTLNLDTAAVYVVSMASGATITTISYTNRDNNPSVNTIMLVVKYAGSASITFTNVIWANGVAPTLTGTNGYADVFMLTSYQGGAGTPVWIGTVVSQALVSTNL